MALPFRTTVPVANVNRDGFRGERPLHIVGLSGGGELVIWLGDKDGPDCGRLFVEATPRGYRVEFYKPNEDGGNAILSIESDAAHCTISADTDELRDIDVVTTAPPVRLRSGKRRIETLPPDAPEVK